MTDKNYFIKEGYRCNLDSKGKATPFVGDKTMALRFQVPVYEFAEETIKKYGSKSVLDVGCGWGVKLNEFVYPVCRNIVGIDGIKEKIRFCRKEYPFGRWFVDNIESTRLKLNRTFDLVISSDVIEHLADPDKLLFYIRKFSSETTFIIISTPERDLFRGKGSFGPPANPAHVREWNTAEFKRYIESRKFRILNHFLVAEGRGFDGETCQVILSQKG